MRLKRIYREAMFVRFDMTCAAGKDELVFKKNESFFYSASIMNNEKADDYEEHVSDNEPDSFHINGCMEEFGVSPRRCQRKQFW